MTEQTYKIQKEILGGGYEETFRREDMTVSQKNTFNAANICIKERPCNENGVKDGIVIHRYSNGDLQSETTYRNGRKEGQHNYYYPRAAGETASLVCLSGKYKKNLKQGRWSSFSKSGEETSYENYKNDRLHGRSTQPAINTADNTKLHRHVNYYWYDKIVSKSTYLSRKLVHDLLHLNLKDLFRMNDGNITPGTALKSAPGPAVA